MTPIPADVRAWIYRIAVAVVPILALHGLVTDTEATLYLALVAAVLDVSLAAAHTPTTGQD